MIYILTCLLTLVITGTIFQSQAKNVSDIPAIAATCQPVDGNQEFFGGKALFNTFYGRPVPFTFFLKGDKQQVHDAALVLEVPALVKVVGAFQINKHVGDIRYKINYTKVTRHGKKYTRFTISGNLARGLTKKFTGWKSSQISVGFDAPISFTSGRVYWWVKNNGKKFSENYFELRFHKPVPLPSKNEQGQFRVMCWNPVRSLAWHDKKLQKSAADLMLASGIRENLAFSDVSSYRGKFDQYLQSRGIDLILHGNVTGGPANVGHWDGSPNDAGVPGAMAPDGKRSLRYAAPIPMLESKKFAGIYKAKVKQMIDKGPKSNYVAFDYEPWHWPEEMGFGPKTQAAFSKQYSLPKNLAPEVVLDKFRKQWTMFWVDISRKTLKMMAEDVRAANPNAKIITYTYFHDYDKYKDNQWELFKSCPKDPRQEAQITDEVMFSAYHIHGKKLVDAIRMSKRHISHSTISVIDALSRHTKLHSWVGKGDALSPQRIYQDAVLCAALGIKRYGLYPGTMIDGAFYIALGKASRLIWAHEKFYYHGKNIHNLVTVKPTGKTEISGEDSFAYTAQQKDGKRLVTLFNFTDKPLQLLVAAKAARAQRYTVAPFGVKLVNVE